MPKWSHQHFYQIGQKISAENKFPILEATFLEKEATQTSLQSEKLELLKKAIEIAKKNNASTLLNDLQQKLQQIREV